MIQLRDVTKTFPVGAEQFRALKGIHLEVERGEFVAVVGKSGSGKSTLLHMIGGIDKPSAGEVLVKGEPVHQMSQDQVAVWRGKNVGVVFQFFQLLPTLTVIENVMIPMDFCNSFPARARRDRAMELLAQFDIANQATKLPASLSGGEQQRAAMARALANDPPVLLADEPTGNLDTNTAKSVLQLFQDLSVKGKTIVMVTHERDIQRFAGRMIALCDGRIDHENALA
ncbi:ABC transporter ATP-binding protein [bacterium]|nr:ABC transporter ATP-binding protein [bacterium]